MPVRIFLLLLTVLILRQAFPSGEKPVPALNRAIIAYVEKVMGTQVDRGECWDLAYQALESTGAAWDGQYRYGKKIDPRKDPVYPGDLIQLEKVKVTYQKDNTFYTESYPHHTAIIYRVYGKGKYQLAHQNTGFSGRKVGLSDFDMTIVKKGKMFFYRPVSK